MDEKKLREVFRLAGIVTNVELNRDKDGKSRGHGVVEFSHPVEAVQAISMFNNQVQWNSVAKSPVESCHGSRDSVMLVTVTYIKNVFDLPRACTIARWLSGSTRPRVRLRRSWSSSRHASRRD